MQAPTFATLTHIFFHTHAQRTLQSMDSAEGQGDQMSLFKNCPKCSQIQFYFVKTNAYTVLPRKEVTRNLGLLSD
jgi:phage FluMu protein Com